VGAAGGDIGALDVVTAEQIAATGATDLRAALALVPTLVLEDTGGLSGQVTISLRGSSARQVLLLVDGHRVRGGSLAPLDLNDLGIPVERVLRIEVIPAPVSVIYGPDAIGGVVNIVTLPAGSSSALAVAYGRGSDNDQLIAGGVQLGYKQLGLRLDGALLTGDGYRDNGDFDLKDFTVGAAVAPAPWGLDVRWSSHARESGVPGPVAHPTPQARRTSEHDGLRADVVYLPVGQGWDFKVGLFSQNQSLRFTDPAPPTLDPAIPAVPSDARRDGSSRGAEAQLDFDTSNGESYSIGAEWASDSATLGDQPERSADRWSVYAQDRWRSGDWSAVGAIRRDQHSEYGAYTNTSLAVSWGSGGWKVWTAWARNYRIPGFDELYQDEQFLKGDPLLVPETSESFDGGIEIGGASAVLRVSAFHRSVDNLITWSDPDGDLVVRAANVAEATVSGWEAAAIYRPSPSFSIPVGYQQLSTEDGETGAALPGSVRHHWRAALQGTGQKLSWSLEYVAVDRAGAASDTGGGTDTTVNAALVWRDRFGSVPVQVSLRLENLQDRAYQSVEGYPMRGRSWFAEARIGL
jgi:outer membrane cobalamin receptor